MWFKTGTKEKVHNIPMHEISVELGKLTFVLLAFYAVTGCDSTSCFKSRGKKRSLSILRNSADEFQSLKKKLGDVFHLTNELIKVCKSFICRLYEVKSYTNNINLLRYKIFCKKPQQNHTFLIV